MQEDQFCGKKLRMLGKVSCTVQCIIDGGFLGTLVLKQISLKISNSEMFSNVFADADLQPTSNAEIRVLLQTDPSGKLIKGNSGQTQFQMSSGYIYEMGHGRQKC